MAFRFSVVSDVREVLRNNDAMEKGFEATADSLDELAREAQRSGDRVERSLDDAGDAADDASTQIERKFREAFREVERDAKSAGDEVGDRMKRGGREAEDSVDRLKVSTGEFRDEARSNFSEVASSFSGDMDSAMDLVQGTLGGLAGSPELGAAGVALGGLGAVAGLVYNAWAENTEKTKQIVADMYESMKESGAAYVGEEYVRQAADDIIQGADTAIVSMDRVRATVEATGLSAGTVLRAYAGDSAAMAEVIGTAADKQRELQDEASATNTSQIAQLQDVRDSFDSTNGKLDEAREKYETWNQVVEESPDEKTLDVNVNTEPGRMGLGDFERRVSQTRPVVPVAADMTDADRDLALFAGRARRTVVTISPRLGMEAV